MNVQLASPSVGADAENEPVYSDKYTHASCVRNMTTFCQSDLAYAHALPIAGNDGVTIWWSTKSKSIVYNTWTENTRARLEDDPSNIERAWYMEYDVPETPLPLGFSVPLRCLKSRKLHFVYANGGVWCLGNTDSSHTIHVSEVLRFPDLVQQAAPPAYLKRFHEQYRLLKPSSSTNADTAPASGEVVVQFGQQKWAVSRTHLERSSNLWKTMADMETTDADDEQPAFQYTSAVASEVAPEVASKAGALLLRLIFTGSLPALPDDVCVQEVLLREAAFLVLEPDLCAILYSRIGSQLNTNTLCSMSQLSEDLHLGALKVHCDKMWRSVSPETTKRLCMSNWNSTERRCSKRPQSDASPPVHKRVRTSS